MSSQHPSPAPCPAHLCIHLSALSPVSIDQHDTVTWLAFKTPCPCPPCPFQRKQGAGESDLPHASCVSLGKLLTMPQFLHL